MADDANNDISTNNKDAPSVPFVDPEGQKIWPRHRRQALRRARKLGLDPKDGDDALHMLKDRGLDVFAAEDSILDVARSYQGDADSDEEPDFPIPTPPAKNPDANQNEKPPVFYEREIAVAKIQRDLVVRRRWRLQLLFMRLLVFVFLPTAICAHYYYNLATDMYETNSSFVIQTSESGGGGGIGGLLAGTGFATSQDSVVVQDYLNSREAFLRLENDFDYSSQFRDPAIDPIQRLEPEASLDQAYKLYRRNVTLGYDQTEGIIRMKVVAPSPEASQAFAKALVEYAEERVDTLSLEARGDQVSGAEELYAKAEQDMLDAQQKVLELQQLRGILSADAEISSQMSIILGLETEAENRRLALAEVMDNANPNPIRERSLRREIERIESRVAELRVALIESDDSTVPLARISGELSIAESELATRQVMLQQSLVQLESAVIQAHKQVRYLSMGVAPVAPIEATYPKRFEGTLLAFLVFSAIYIFASLTISILREQVSV